MGLMSHERHSRTMSPMSTPYELSGRVAQKARTREALVAAARTLVAEGATPTVEDAAEAASISRTTAYRYFPNKRALLFAAHPETAAFSMLPPDAPEDPAARLAAMLGNFSAMILATEAQQRTMLRLSLEATAAERKALPLRQGRAVAWIAEALDGLRGDLPDALLDQLALAIRATTGIEAVVWLVDVAGLSRDDAVALTHWSAQALLQYSTVVPAPTPMAPGGRATGKGTTPGRRTRGTRVNPGDGRGGRTRG